MSKTRPFYDKHLTVRRRCVYVWRPIIRWPVTWHHTHSPEGAEQPIIHGLVFRTERDAAEHETALLDLGVGPQPFSFSTWAEAENWVNEDEHIP